MPATDDIGVMEAIYSQRQITRYRRDPVSREDIEKIIDAAIRAPSGGNTQPWHFIAITEPDLIQKIGGLYRDLWLGAQGAEPLGQPWIVTACEANTVKTLGSRPALEVLQETLMELDDATRERAVRNLLVGLAMNEYKETHERGDFLIRNVMSADRESGAVAINAIPRVGQTFQFQFRDAQAADDDLRARLSDLRDALQPDEEVLGALLCSCNGRGRGLFGEPDHDAAALSDIFGPVPTAGFFCNGEIGPVGGENYLHGFTASIAVLTSAATESECDSL